MKKYIPNSLTIFRIVLVPVFIWFAFISTFSDRILWATIVFILASITDLLDGLLARKFDVVSNFGKIMDPLADKILVISALFALALPMIELINIYVVYIIIFRELAVSILRNQFIRKNIYLAANKWGKFKTLSQIIGIITALVYYSILTRLFPILNDYYLTIQIIFKISFWLIAFVTIISGISYFLPKKEEK